MTAYVAPVVEGDGEVAALPILIRRIATELLGGQYCDVRKPWHLPRDQFEKTGRLGKAVEALSRNIEGAGGILLVLDQDDAPCTLELSQSITAELHMPCKVEVVVAAREYEAWFLASVESLRVHSDVKDDASYIGDPESPRDAKKRLEAQMHGSYRETLHQAKFSSLIDLDTSTARSRSFRRLVSAVESLLS